MGPVRRGAVLAGVFTVVLLPSVCLCGGAITHMAIVDDVLKDPRLNGEIRRILEEYIDYAKGGAVGPDMFYFPYKRYANIAHYCSPTDLARKMIKDAKARGRPEEIAYAYGWLLHVVTDVEIHKFVNLMVKRALGLPDRDTGEYKEGDEVRNRLHHQIEYEIDFLNWKEHGKYPLTCDDPSDPNGCKPSPIAQYRTNLSVAHDLVRAAYYDQFGCEEAVELLDYSGSVYIPMRQNGPSSLQAGISGVAFEGLWVHGYLPRKIGALDSHRYQGRSGYDIPEYREAYRKALQECVRAVNRDADGLPNYDLDSGLRETDRDYTGKKKCEELGRLVDCDEPGVGGSPGGDHADDIASVAGSTQMGFGGASSRPVSLDWLYRPAAKKGLSWVSWLAEVEQANAEYKALPLDTPLEVLLGKLDTLHALSQRLKGPWNLRDLAQNNPELATEIEMAPEVAVLRNGYFRHAANLVHRDKELTRDVGVDSLLGSVGWQPLLVIPSGGLNGLERSVFFRDALDEYVRRGGSVLVFAQQHGYEYSVLPVPQESDGSYRRVYGVGWDEDISCFFGAAHINEWHQVLSGLWRPSPSLSVDGYITEYPTNARVLLKRNKNGYPVLLMYEYGLGRVIVTTMYTDSAYGQGQASSEELALVRDIIAWAKRPGDLPEARPGDVVEFPIEVVNRSGGEASSVRFLVYAPGRGSLVWEHLSPLSLVPGMSAEVPFSYGTSSRSPLGIYHVDYVLLDADGAVVQPQSETDSGRFVVAAPPPPGYQGCGLTFSVASDADGYLTGATATLTATVYNATDQARRVTALFEGHSEEVSVPAKGSASALFTKVVGGWGDYRVSFYEGKEYRGWASKRCGGYYPSASVGIRAERGIYRLGESVSLRATLRNGIPLDWEGRVRVSVRGPRWEEVFGQEGPFGLPLGGGEGEISVSLPLSVTSVCGSYTVSLEVRYGDRLIASGHGGFEVLRSRVAVSATLPEVFRAGMNEVIFALTNTGKVDVGSGVLAAAMVDPAGRTVWEREFPFSLGVGQSTTVSAQIGLASPVLGTYTLRYAQRDETGDGVSSSRRMSNRGFLVASLDRSSYKVRELAVVHVDVRNSGSFAWEAVGLKVVSEEMGFFESRTVSLLPGQSGAVDVSIPVKEGISPGGHKVDVTLELSPGATLSSSTGFFVPPSYLAMACPGGPVLVPGDAVTVAVENIGGLDTTYRTEVLRVMDEKGAEIYQGSASGSILSGENKALASIQVPGQASSGKAHLEVLLRDEGTGREERLFKGFEIRGLEAAVETRTGQDVYLRGDVVLGDTAVRNGAFPIQGGTLRVGVSLLAPTGVSGFEAFFPRPGYNSWTTRPLAVAVGADGRLHVPEGDRDRIWGRAAGGESGWEELWDDLGEPRGIAATADGRLYVADAARGEVLEYEGGPMGWGFGGGFGFAEPSGVSLGPDGSVYVVDAGLHGVARFGRDGDLLGFWGQQGDGEGQMRSPRGVAVSADGRLYVADTGNHRVQVFDSEGRFLAAWGWQGDGQGEFLHPHGVALGPDGSVYVADTGNHRIQRFDSEGCFLGVWGGQGDGEGRFRSPHGVAVGPDGSVYVADTGNSRIQAFDDRGTFLFAWMIGYCEPTCGERCEERGLDECYEQEDASRFEWGLAMAVSADGTFYAINPRHHLIQRLDFSWPWQPVFSEWGGRGSGQGEFQDPRGLALGPDGSVYVADTGNHRIQRFDSEGNFLGAWGEEGDGDGEFRSPEGVAVGPDGSVYVVDTGNHRVQLFDPDGNLLAKWGTQGEAPGEFRYPRGVAVGATGYVYVADTGNHRIQRFDKEGRFAGAWGGEGRGDGEFDSPVALAVGPFGFVYVAEGGNRRVQRFDRDGNFRGAWSLYECDYGGMERCQGAFGELTALCVGPDGSVYAADSDRIYGSVNEDEAAQSAFEASYPVDLLAGAEHGFTSGIGRLQESGAYLLEATLWNSLGEVLGQASHRFWVVSEELVVRLSAEKRIYRIGETVRITGNIENLSGLAAKGLWFHLGAEHCAGGSVELISEPVELPARATMPISVTMTAAAEGRIHLNGVLIRDDRTLVEVVEPIDVERPMVSYSLDLPEVVGNEWFPVRVRLWNRGRLPASLGVEVRDDAGLVLVAEELALEGGEGSTLEVMHQVRRDTALALVLSGDISAGETRVISYGLGLGVALAPEALYGEGTIGVPVSVTNTGRLDEVARVVFRVSPGGSELMRSYALSAGETACEVVFFTLAEGDYVLTAASEEPHSLAQAGFLVRGQGRVGLSLAVGGPSGGAIPVSAQVGNLGAGELSLTLSATVMDGAGDRLWSAREALSGLIPGACETVRFQVPLFALSPGDYTLGLEVAGEGGEVVASKGASFTVQGASVELVQLPAYQTVRPGELASFVFRVRNCGDVEGGFSLAFKAPEVVDSLESGWLGPGEEREVTFVGGVPEDLYERDCFGTFELEAQGRGGKGVVRYRVAGVDLEVQASLDKTRYRQGDTARLFLQLRASGDGSIPLLARVSYGGFEEERSFSLSGTGGLTFDIPLARITGERLFYGIYHASGRSIRLDSLPVIGEGGLLGIVTDRRLYRPGEQLLATITGEIQGTMTLSGPGGYKESFPFSGSASRALVLPAVMRAGTYFLVAELQGSDLGLVTASCPFDVAGIEVKVKEATLDRARYEGTDTLQLGLRIEGNEALGCAVRCWVVDPEGEYTLAGEAGVVLSDAEPVLVVLTAGLSTTKLGIHRLVYGIYFGEVLLCSGSEAFDVGNGVLLGVATDKTEYPLGTEPVGVEMSLLGVGEGAIEVFLDGISQGVVPVRLEGGVSSWPFTVNPTTPGRHRLQAVLTVGGLTSSGEAAFSYGTGLSDLTVDLWGGLEEGGETPSGSLILVARNMGRGSSGPTVVVLYQGEGTQPIGTWDVGALGAGEAISISHSVSLSGAPGPRTFRARIDPQDRVMEYDEGNNESYLSLTVPELSLVTVTDKGSYGLGETVVITARIRNYLCSPLQGLLLETVVKDPWGVEVLSRSQGFDLAGSSQIDLETGWATHAGYALGPYSIEQRVVDRGASSRRSVVLGSGQDFSIQADFPFRKVEIGGEVEFGLRVVGIGGFSGDVGLSLVGAPPDCTVYFVSNPVAVRGGEAAVGLRVLTTSRTAAGSYGMRVVGRWGEVVRGVDLSLEVVGFEVRVTPAVSGVRQLESGAFAVSVSCLGPYEGEVFLAVRGVPKGVRATLSADVLVPPGAVELEVETSRWVLPGRYELVVRGSGRVFSHEAMVVLDVEGNPALSPAIVTVPGGGPRGVPLVRVHGVDGGLMGEFLAFGTRYGAGIAAGDIDGDGLDEVVVGSVGRGGRALLGAFGVDGEPLTSLEVPHGDKRGALSVACGDVDGDWVEEVVVGSYEPFRRGGKGAVRVYKYLDSRFVEAALVLYPFQGVDYRKAPQVAVGDVDGDGRGELIVAPGGERRAPSHVKVFGVDTEGGLGRWSAHPVTEMVVDPGGYGANVASCDTDGDGRAEIFLGAGPGPRRGTDVTILGSEEGGLYVRGGFEAYAGGRYGVVVSCGDTDGDGLAEVITGPGPGPGNPPLVRIFDREGELREEFTAYPIPTTYGVRPAGARIGEGGSMGPP